VCTQTRAPRRFLGLALHLQVLCAYIQVSYLHTGTSHARFLWFSNFVAQRFANKKRTN
jgi:hypothetical protein